MHPTRIENLIRQEFLIRKKKWPSPLSALLWFDTEVGEMKELILAEEGGWVRNHPEDHGPYNPDKLSEEVGDAICMLMVFCIVKGIRNPLYSLIEKLERHIGDQKDG